MIVNSSSQRLLCFARFISSNQTLFTLPIPIYHVAMVIPSVTFLHPDAPKLAVRWHILFCQLQVG
jgi:hypothetical protein